MPTRERGSSPSGSVTGASGISEAPKEDSAVYGEQGSEQQEWHASLQSHLSIIFIKKMSPE